jgi:hypothetical protein
VEPKASPLQLLLLPLLLLSLPAKWKCGFSRQFTRLYIVSRRVKEARWVITHSQLPIPNMQSHNGTVTLQRATGEWQGFDFTRLPYSPQGEELENTQTVGVEFERGLK